MDTVEALLIAVLVLVSIMFLFQIELYRNLLAVLAYYRVDASPPVHLRFSGSFLGKKGYKAAAKAGN